MTNSKIKSNTVHVLALLTFTTLFYGQQGRLGIWDMDMQQARKPRIYASLKLQLTQPASVEPVSVELLVLPKMGDVESSG